MSAKLRAACSGLWPSHGAAATLLLALAALFPAPSRAQFDPLAEEDEEAETSAESNPEAAEDEASLEDEPELDAVAETELTESADSDLAAEGEALLAPESGGDLVLHAATGVGVGTLSFARPIAQGVQRLPATAFAALELALRAHAWPHDALSLETLLAYQTSIGLELQFDPLFGLPEEIDVRTQSFEVSAAPVLRLGEEDSGIALAFPVGFAFRSFVTEVHEFPVAGYGVGGPLLRAEFWLRLGELVRLRIGPEAQWIVIVDGPMRREGACCQGVAIGGQGVLEASVGPVFRVAFAYHESRAFVPLDYRFEDVVRYLTARIAGDL